MSQFSRQFASYIDYYYKGMFYELLEDRIVCEAIGKSLGDRNLVWSGSEPGFDKSRRLLCFLRFLLS